MKLSLNWLKDYVEIENLTTEEIASKLTMSGSKVETITKDGGQIKDIIIGKIISIKKHENADKLLICEVLINENETKRIITSAQNVVEGAFVAVCLNNSVIYDGMVIKDRNFKGIKSQGMMCSLGELGLSKDAFPYAIEDGIFLIEEECKIGQDVKTVLGLKDTILDFEITSNRPDCLSVYDLARETAATFSKNLKEIELFNDDSKKESPIKVNIKTDKCTRYMTVLIENVKIAPSPLKIRNRLRVSGIKPINNVVDLTNYVMLELGVPMHAFDAEKVENLEITIRNAKKDEKINTLDNLEHSLKEEDIIISDSKKPLAIAGVIGAKECSVTNNTKTVILEVACFNGETVRKTSKSLNIKTESALRFEKGLNPKVCEQTIKRACNLILNLNIGEINTKIKDLKNFKEEESLIKIDYSYINNFIGTNLKQEEMQKILISLGFNVEKDYVKVPEFRVDIKNIADLAEEVARIYGYDKIPCVLPCTTTKNFGLSNEQQIENLIKNTATSLGLFEIFTFSFVDPSLYEKMELNEEEILKNSVKIKNPFGKETSLMRRTLLASMLQTLSYNHRNKIKDAALFEISKTYEKDETKKIKEEEKISIGIYGKNASFFKLKGIIECFLKALQINEVEFVKTSKPYLHPFISCEIVKENQTLGFFGEVMPNVCENFKLCKKVYVAELNLLSLIKNSSTEKKFKPISKFPSIERDLSLICDEEQPSFEIVKQIKKTIGNILEKVEIFDVYKGDQLENFKKSISFKITMRKQDATLKDDEANSKIKETLNNLEKLNVFLRK